ncbi:MAG: sensor histidine kinase [Paenibacillaceae bacterium]|jgi:signal transduction histidine kinase|nr:sensor histidine kinase [Paenibacillaceae bacterium]
MRSFWIWLLFLSAAWLGALLSLPDGRAVLPWRLAVIALFFALYFAAPLLRKHPLRLTVVLSGAAVMATAALWPEAGPAAPTGQSGLYKLILYTLLAGKAAYRLPPAPAGIAGLVIMASLMAPGLLGCSSLPLPFLILYTLIAAAGLAVFNQTRRSQDEIRLRYEALLSEYRSIKRRSISDEKTARQEERTQIARDIHDSVGHKLTALLMQLEVLRMEADGELARRAADLKELAKESLEETRIAVKSLKQQETGGLTAILNMIRRLEAEQFMRVHFTVKHGALSVPLSAAQSFAIYRAVQEALTNVMKHGETREAAVTFEAPGGGLFRFEVANKVKNSMAVRDGFGLQSMKERIRDAGGTLTAIAYSGSFIIRGELPVEREQGGAG